MDFALGLGLGLGLIGDSVVVDGKGTLAIVGDSLDRPIPKK